MMSDEEGQLLTLAIIIIMAIGLLLHIAVEWAVRKGILASSPRWMFPTAYPEDKK